MQRWTGFAETTVWLAYRCWQRRGLLGVQGLMVLRTRPLCHPMHPAVGRVLLLHAWYHVPKTHWRCCVAVWCQPSGASWRAAALTNLLPWRPWSDVLLLP